MNKYLRAVLTVLATATAFWLAACGSGSNNNGPVGPDYGPLLSGKVAQRSQALANYKAWRATKTYLFDTLRAAQVVVPELLKLLPPVGRAVEPVTGFGLWRAAPVLAGNTITIAYFSDSAGTKAAGTIKVLLPAAALTGSPLTAFPALCTVKLAVTGGVLPATGDVSLSLRSAKGAAGIKGTVLLTNQVIGVDYDLSISDAQAITGKYSVRTHQATAVHSSLMGTPPASMVDQVAIEPYKWAGTTTAGWTTSDYEMKLNIGTAGQLSSKSSANSSLTIGYPDTGVETIAAPLTAKLDGAAPPPPVTPTSRYQVPKQVPIGFSAVDINNSNVVAGTVWAAGMTDRPAWWPASGGPTTALRNLPGGQQPHGMSAISDSGAFVGTFADGVNPPRSVYWASASAQPTFLPAPAGISGVRAIAINAKNQIVGNGSWYATPQAVGLPSAAFWPSPTVAAVRLHTTLGMEPVHGDVKALNNKGLVIGSITRTVDVSIPAFWVSPHGQGPTELAHNEIGWSFGDALACNDAGEIVGYELLTISNEPHMRATSWSSPGGPSVFLQPITGFDNSKANSINARSQVVGECTTGVVDNKDHERTAVLWEKGKGVAIDSLLPADSGWRVQYASKINDAGVILARAYEPNGTTLRDVVLIPN